MIVMTQVRANDGLVAFLRSRGASQLADSVARYPLPVASVAELMCLRGCTVAAAASASSIFVGCTVPHELCSQSTDLTTDAVCPPVGQGPLDEDEQHKLLQRPLKDLRADCLRFGLLTNGTKLDLAARLLRFRERQLDGGLTVQPLAKPTKVDPLQFMKRGAVGPPPKGSIEFSVIADSRERAHGKHQHVLDAFERAGVAATSMVLPAGDFWLVHGVTGKVLPVAIERKTINDLLQSIVSARFDDQKRVLFRSPFRDVVYLIEGNLDGLPDEDRRRVLSACLTTALVDGFTVVRTASLDESVMFMDRLGRRLANRVRAEDCATLEACEASCQELHDALQLASLPQRMLCHVHGCSARIVSELGVHCKSLDELFGTLTAGQRDVDFSSASKALKKLLQFLATFLGESATLITLISICHVLLHCPLPDLLHNESMQGLLTTIERTSSLCMFQHAWQQRQQPQRQDFSGTFHAYPSAFTVETPQAQIKYGGQLLLPSSCLAEISRLNLPFPLQFVIKTYQGATCFASVREFNAPPGQVILPDWMFVQLRLKEGEMLRISTVSLEQGKLIKIRPRERSFIEISNPKRVLEDHLRDHHVLTKGSTIVIFYADIEFRIDIMDIIGRDGRSIDGVSTVNARNVERGTELQVEFMRPLDMPPSPPQDTLAPPAGNRTPPPQGANVIQGQQGVSFTPMVFQPPSLTPPTSAEAKPASQPVASFTAFAGSGRSLGGGRQPPAGAPAASSQPPAPAPSSTGGSFTAFGGQGRSLR